MLVVVDLYDVSPSDVINGQDLRKPLGFQLYGELVWPFHRLLCLKGKSDFSWLVLCAQSTAKDYTRAKAGDACILVVTHTRHWKNIIIITVCVRACVRVYLNKAKAETLQYTTIHHCCSISRLRTCVAFL